MDITPIPIPMPLAWEVAPVSWRDGADGSLTVAAGPGTDLFVDPAGAEPVLTAPRLLGPAPDGDFQLSTRVRVDFAATYDAGCLLVYGDPYTWAKLAYERSPQGDGMAVSVVTRGASDDANGFVVPAGTPLWLRISRLGPAWAFHASTDGNWWHFVRYFRLDAAGEPLRIGLEAQSPTGSGCTVVFDRIGFEAARLADLRDGR
ncbi:DUF1349 domain-containing protein [Micromonospora sp. HM5-17]|jgi:regulation of enolase protein 1 (concanavalin A-like superfamily)|uniref:DUF1349 domain-containing protein n=1 Tax=Micromonospora sp. HM5-17 TaxID=2487710 RepID=UPI000F47F25C|nr:DUF1349 domain-containing protein [Micromonospora sp. HM5-17]ROT28279.1 DUF1349 domain-containing protein [Micromonospora sp. HM5-17]